MKECKKATYSPPHLAITDFEPVDVLLLSDGSDGNESIWRPISNSLHQGIFDL